MSKSDMLKIIDEAIEYVILTNDSLDPTDAMNVAFELTQLKIGISMT